MNAKSPILFAVLLFTVSIGTYAAEPDASDSPQKATPAATKTITNSIGMKLVLIPAGEFLMGSPEDEGDRDAGEKQHRVRITKPFYVGAYEVTQEQWQKVMGTKLRDQNRNQKKSPTHKIFYGEGATYPMYYVSWFDAVVFCNSLSALEGRSPYYALENVHRRKRGPDSSIRWADVKMLGGNGYRLPTEAEWEYACRAGTKTRFYWGDNDAQKVMTQYCWYQKNANDRYWSDPHAAEEGAQPVGTKRPNAWGLYDMNGNVWEWCQDWFGEDYYQDSPVDDPMGPTTAAYLASRHGEPEEPSARAYRMTRGADWGEPPGFCRSACRSGGTPDDRFLFGGFRVARLPRGEPRGPASKGR